MKKYCISCGQKLVAVNGDNYHPDTGKLVIKMICTNKLCKARYCNDNFRTHNYRGIFNPTCTRCGEKMI